jgi:heat shock protein HslJ
MHKASLPIFVALILTMVVACSGNTTPTATSGGMPSSGPTDANVPALHRTWQWEVRVNPSSGAEEKIDDPSKYTLSFKADGTYQFQADCNQGSGTYGADDKGAIRMEVGPVTLAECGSGSRYQEVINMMQAVQDYRLDENGAVLVLVWPAGGPEDNYRAQ